MVGTTAELGLTTIGVASFGRAGDGRFEAVPSQAAIAVFDPGVPTALPHDYAISWAPVAGATTAEVDGAGVRIGASATSRALGELDLEASGSDWVVKTQNKRISALTLTGLVQANSDELRDAGLRLVVALPGPSGGWGPPQYAVPPCPAQGQLPRSLTGAAYANRVLTLPDVQATRLRLSLVTGDFPGDFASQPMPLTGVSGTESVLPTEVTVTGPDGATLFAFPGAMPLAAPDAEVDLTIPAAAALTAAVAAGQPPTATFHLTGQGTIALRERSARGSLVASVPGVVRTVLAGEPVAPELGRVTLPAEAPTSATADLTVRYDGIRVLPAVSDPTPTRNGDQHGVVVTDSPGVRVFPPQALLGRTVRRVAVIGRPATSDGAEIQVQLISSVTAAPIGPAAVLVLPASPLIAAHWVELADPVVVDGPASLRVTATAGRFLWVVRSDDIGVADHPTAKIAIDDPDYEPRELSLAGVPLSAPAAVPESHQPAFALPAGVLRDRVPLLESLLFLTVDLSDLALRYRR